MKLRLHGRFHDCSGALLITGDGASESFAQNGRLGENCGKVSTPCVFGEGAQRNVEQNPSDTHRINGFHFLQNLMYSRVSAFPHEDGELGVDLDGLVPCRH